MRHVFFAWIFSLYCTTLTAAEIEMRLRMITSEARPGLACVINVELVNAGANPIKVPELHDYPFGRPWAWTWVWNEGKSIHHIGTNDVLYAIPELLPPSDVVLPVGQSVSWLVVIPCPDFHQGIEEAKLQLELESKEATALESILIAVNTSKKAVLARDLDQKWLHVAISTSTGSQAFDWLTAERKPEAFDRWKSEKSCDLLLGWFCAQLGKRKFDEVTWSNLEKCSADVRSIRDVNLGFALERNRLMLDRAMSATISKGLDETGVVADYLRKQLKKRPPREMQVVAYFEAVMSGDVEKANSLADVPFSVDGRRVLKTAEELNALHGEIAKKVAPKQVLPDYEIAITKESPKLDPTTFPRYECYRVTWDKTKDIDVYVSMSEKPKIIGYFE